MIRKLVLAALILSAHVAVGQSLTAKKDSIYQFDASHLARLNRYKLPAQQHLVLSKSFQIPQVIPYHFGSICRWEDMGNQDHQMPMRFRLGSLSYVNKLENQVLVKWDDRRASGLVPSHR
ncbi:MAG: hypothetical protein R2806_19095 [Saprospiraceae bacterium]